MGVNKILHQVWFRFPGGTDAPPPEYDEMRQSWVDFHPDWEFKLWGSEEAREFVVEHFPNVLSTYDSYKNEISRVDAIRYMILSVLGGVYIDCDVLCLAPLDDLLDTRGFIVKDVNHYLLGYNNGVLGFEKNHPLMTACANNLHKSAIAWDQMLKTGPQFLTVNYFLLKDKTEIRILSVKELKTYLYHRHDASWTPIAKFRKALDPERRQYMAYVDVPWMLKPFLKGKVGSKLTK